MLSLVRILFESRQRQALEIGYGHGESEKSVLFSLARSPQIGAMNTVSRRSLDEFKLPQVRCAIVYGRGSKYLAPILHFCINPIHKACFPRCMDSA